ncbi:hypothetical protein MCUN1_001343 [Malassezia cuniculi]|uniref:Small EDRK-rich factor-like N-terminal domain-containing protein n=1 Tax=Malassezia cuniculi TaxID=948313 RepID=A0AAF0ETX5_9BASI|nr:hypothetical protein MCUN1_001343 [Malassezia cuniculi]
MTRGNARELARARNQKKQAEQNKGPKNSGVSLAKRREQDAAALRAKQAAKAAAKEASAATS